MLEWVSRVHETCRSKAVGLAWATSGHGFRGIWLGGDPEGICRLGYMELALLSVDVAVPNEPFSFKVGARNCRVASFPCFSESQSPLMAELNLSEKAPDALSGASCPHSPPFCPILECSCMVRCLLGHLLVKAPV